MDVFSENRLDDFLRGRLARALDELADIDPDTVLSENSDVVVAALIEKHMPTEISVDWSEPSRSPVEEVTMHVRDDIVRDRTHAVSASRMVITFPISGTAEMLNYQASTFGLSGTHGQVRAGTVVVEVVERQLDAGVIRGRIDRARQEVERRLAWANRDLAAFRTSASDSLRLALERRKERILNDRAVEDALGIPVRTSSTPRPPVAARRRQVDLGARRAQSPFVPEPVLEEAIYLDVLGVVRSWANSLERTPGTAAKLGEEELRDLLLGMLNGYWQGGAGGELFNGNGKTDILIREGDRNAFIAECKIWHGPQSATNALDQLLGYLVWRDGKAALIMFIRTADPAATIDRFHAAIESHPAHVLTKDKTNPSNRVDYVVTADDEGRRVSLAAIPVVIRAEST